MFLCHTARLFAYSTASQGVWQRHLGMRQCGEYVPTYSTSLIVDKQMMLCFCCAKPPQPGENDFASLRPWFFPSLRHDVFFLAHWDAPNALCFGVGHHTAHRSRSNWPKMSWAERPTTRRWKLPAGWGYQGEMDFVMKISLKMKPAMATAFGVLSFRCCD